jgi:hypothetical protein
MAYFQIHNHLEFSPMFFENNETLLNNEASSNDGACVICLEQTSKKLSACIFLNSENVSLKKICSCDCVVHQECLNQWLCKSESCPICRKKMSSSIILRNAPESTIWIFVVISFQDININNNVRQVKLFCLQMIRFIIVFMYFALILVVTLNITLYTNAYIKKMT